jgi:hypothetical protein
LFWHKGQYLSLAFYFNFPSGQAWYRHEKAQISARHNLYISGVAQLSELGVVRMFIFASVGVGVIVALLLFRVFFRGWDDFGLARIFHSAI